MRQFSSRVSGLLDRLSEHGRGYASHAVVGSILNAVLVANLPRLLPRLGLLQYGDDLRLGESASSHGRLLTG